MEEIWIIAGSFMVSCFIYLALPFMGKKFKKIGIVGRDVHKINKPLIPEMGGVIFIPPVIALSLIYSTFSPCFLCIAFSTLLFFIYGLLDDLKAFGKWEKLLVSFGISLIISATKLSSGKFSLLLLFSFIFLSIIIGNSINVLAGFNGLETGLSIIIFATIFAYLFLKGNPNLAFFTFCVILFLFSFFLHNKYPSKFFPGNCGTLGIGGILVGLSLCANLYTLILPLLSLHFSDALLKFFTAGYFSSSEKPKSKVGKNGILIPGKGYLSIPKVFMKAFKLSEKKLVSYLLLAQLIIAACVLLVRI